MKGHPRNQSNRPVAQAVDRSAELARAVLGHELGNVLHGLLGMTEMALAGESDPVRARWLRAIRGSGRQLKRLLDRRGLFGECRAERRCFDGIRWLEQVVLSQAPAATDRGIRLLLTMDSALPRAWCTDPSLLRLVVDNLLGNAVKYTAGGDIRVEVTQRGGADRGVNALQIEVCDDGPGLPGALGEELFQPYVRGNGEEIEGVAGIGLGLFVCRGAAAALGGRVESRPAARGACLQLVLPGVLDSQKRAPVVPSALLRAVHCRLKLDAAVRRSVSALLDRWGVCWIDDGGPVEAQQCLLVEEAHPAPGAPGPVLVLVDESGSGWSRRLPGPVLESTLLPALLEAATLPGSGQALSPREKRDSPSESSRAGPPGGSGRRPA